MATGAVAVPYFAPTTGSQQSHGVEGNSDKIQLKFGFINDLHHTTIEHNLAPDIG